MEPSIRDRECLALINSVEESLDKKLCSSDEIATWGGNPLTKHVAPDWLEKVRTGRLRIGWARMSDPDSILVIGDFYIDSSGNWDVQLGTPEYG